MLIWGSDSRNFYYFTTNLRVLDWFRRISKVILGSVLVRQTSYDVLRKSTKNIQGATKIFSRIFVNYDYLQ